MEIAESVLCEIFSFFAFLFKQIFAKVLATVLELLKLTYSQLMVTIRGFNEEEPL